MPVACGSVGCVDGWMGDGIVVLAWESSHCSSALDWLDSYGQQRNLSEALFSQVRAR